MKKAIILANGKPPAKRMLRSHVESADIFICADGGANTAAAMDIEPQVIIGDLDSVRDATLKKLIKSDVKWVRDQNSTDLEKALAYAITKGCKSAVILGAMGGRIDHELGNLSAMAKFSDRITILSMDKYGMLIPVIGTMIIPLTIGTTISLLPLTSCEGITTTGLQWNLTKETLRFGYREGTSNTVISTPFKISLRKGHLILYVMTVHPKNMRPSRLINFNHLIEKK